MPFGTVSATTRGDMRFIHTADWHLGRLLSGVSLLEDQSVVLDEIIELAAYVRPDALLVSGDVYDRAFPLLRRCDCWMRCLPGWWWISASR